MNLQGKKAVAQNLRDQISQAEKCINIASTPLTYIINAEINTMNIENHSFNDVNDGNEIQMPEMTPLSEIEIKEAIKAKDLLPSIAENVGDMSNRLWSTKLKRIPKDEDITAINNICYSLIVENEIVRSNEYFKALWFLNCIIYVSIIGWLLTNNIKCEINVGANYIEKVRQPKYLVNINKEIEDSRRLLSQSSAEISRLKCNGRMTRKTKRNRKRIEKKINGVISVYSITKLIMKLKARTRRLTKKRKRKIINEKSRDWNRKFKS